MNYTLLGRGIPAPWGPLWVSCEPSKRGNQGPAGNEAPQSRGAVRGRCACQRAAPRPASGPALHLFSGLRGPPPSAQLQRGVWGAGPPTSRPGSLRAPTPERRAPEGELVPGLDRLIDRLLTRATPGQVPGFLPAPEAIPESRSGSPLPMMVLGSWAKGTRREFGVRSR
ncbi:hypothetical protein NDU88_010626 [Pleurodeles waltl]|uniref:Uncharacterized protein n=1 Tax=Pleurodeles waltl TaxID=8319 RepID=A0AAV7QYH5_PLEWA|nr:hypothetical protein NDU88_010626 [Pleurodeles waltl]